MKPTIYWKSLALASIVAGSLAAAPAPTASAGNESQSAESDGRILRADLDEDVTPDSWRSVSLELAKEDGSRVEVFLLRPLWWLDAYGAKVGGSIDLDLEEFGVSGTGTVTEIGPCKADSRKAPNGYRVVIGKFAHESEDVWDLVFSDDPKPLGVTSSHPLFSTTANRWVVAGDLKIGERVETHGGRGAVLLSRQKRPGRHRVYNLEVHRDHTYFVGSQALWAHNFCNIRLRHDAMGRVTSAFAEITPAHIGTGTATNAATRSAARAIGNSTDDAGHLVGKLLGGPGGKRAGNFFAQNPHINRGQFAQFESFIAGEVSAGRRVFVRISPRYIGTSTRASEIVYQARIDGQTLTRTFLNP